MNADRIIVVENGEIIEQGSHNELIVASGRYADLWSKQVFVRPNDAAKEAEGAAAGGGIVNDLSTEQTQTELSKVKPAPAKPEDKEPTKKESVEPAEDQDRESIKEDMNSGQKLNGSKNGIESTPKHKREVIFFGRAHRHNLKSPNT